MKHTVLSAAICWTIGQKIHAAAGRKFVALPCLQLEAVLTPFPRRLLHQLKASSPPSETIKKVSLFQRDISSATQASGNEPLSTPRPPQI